VGFPRSMIGNVKLEQGEGITGFAAECLRPVSAAVAQEDTHYKHVPDLGEERYPTFLALPLVMGGQAMGVLNLQRKVGGDFTSAEVALAAALATPFTLALDRALNRAPQTHEPHELGRSARLTGSRVGRGHAVGKAHSALTFRALSELQSEHRGAPARKAVEQAAERVRDTIARTEHRLDPELLPEHRRALAALSVTLHDQRLMSQIGASSAELGIVAGLRKVAREYVTAPYLLGGEGQVDPWMSARAGEIEDLCLWIGGEALNESGPGPGSVAVFAERLGAFSVLWALARGVAGIVVEAGVDEHGLPAGVARAGKLPVVAEVAGLFAWVRSGDTVLVDADQSLVRVNPSATVLAQYRHSR
jgi:phosphotransferase system, enzyme I, PtsP